jgi:predicted transcriptional regulator
MADGNSNKAPDDELLHMTATVVAAYVQKNSVPAGKLGEVIDAVYASLRTLDGNIESRQEPHKPAVPVKKSVMPEYLICLEDGKKLKMLKRYLRTNYKLTPDAYRHKWGLPPDYPMVAPNYARARSVFAKRIGLGRGGRPAARRGGGRKKSSGG